MLTSIFCNVVPVSSLYIANKVNQSVKILLEGTNLINITLSDNKTDSDSKTGDTCSQYELPVISSTHQLHLNDLFILVSRGFELFKASIVKNIKFHQQAEKKSLSQLKRS